MSQEIENLIRKLSPIRGNAWADQRLQEYANGKFSPTMKKAIEQEVKGLANFYRLEDQIILHPVPRRQNVRGEYKLGQCHYGNLPLNAHFSLQESDWIINFQGLQVITEPVYDKQNYLFRKCLKMPKFLMQRGRLESGTSVLLLVHVQLIVDLMNI